MKHDPENDSATGRATPAREPARSGPVSLSRRGFGVTVAAGVAAAIAGVAGLSRHASTSGRPVAADFGDATSDGGTSPSADWGDSDPQAPGVDDSTGTGVSGG
jgi:hypothetical protein